MTPEEHERLVAALGVVVTDLGEKHYSRAGIVHQAWSVLATIGTGLVWDDSPDEESCRRCGGPLVQTAMGRPKAFCSDRCRREWHRQ